MFPVLRRKLKRAFREVYNSNDFTFEDEPIGQQARKQVNDIREDTNVESWGENLAPEVSERVFTESAACSDEGEE